LDQFGGSGTVSYVSALINRRSIYIDNSKKSFEFAVKRTKEAIEKNAIFEYVSNVRWIKGYSFRTCR
jgi:DNA modification methylase